MLSKKNLYALITIIFSIVFISPFIYVSRFVTLATDDFCLATSTSENYVKVVKDWYFNLNGRYINAVISSIPVYDSFIYQFLMYVQFLMLGLILYSFIKGIMRFYEIDFKNYRSSFLSVVLFISIIANAPSLYELFYWYSAVTVYLYSFFFFVLFLLFTMKEYAGLKSNYILIAILIILLNGNNELFIGITNFLLLVLLIRHYTLKKKLKSSLLFLIIISWVSSAAFIFSPGSLTRQQQFHYGGNFIGSVKVAILYGGKFILESLLEPTYLLFYGFIFLFVYRIVRSDKAKYLKPLFLILISFTCLASMFFIIYYATGLFDVRSGRIGNIVSMVMLIFVFFNIINFAVYIKIKKNSIFVDTLYPAIAVLLIFMIVLIFRNKNYTDLQSDFSNNRFEQFQDNIQERYSILRYTTEKHLVLKPVKGTLLLKSGDAYLQQEESMKSCFISYINKKYNKTIKSIEIKNP